MTIEDSQILQLINQVQGHQTSHIQALLVGISFSLPLSSSQKLAIYHWLLSWHLQEISSFQLTLILVLGPITIVVSLFLLILFVRWFIRSVVPFILSFIGNRQEEKQLIQLIFPEDIDKSAFATEELYRLLHTLSSQLTFWESIVQRKNEYSLEIVSTKKDGIRYLLAAHPKFIDIIRRNLLSYLPGIKIEDINDYLGSFLESNHPKSFIRIAEFKLSDHFALPLNNQKSLAENDPIAYLTGNMTKLINEELVVYQIIVSPVNATIHKKVITEVNSLRSRLYQGQPLTRVVQKSAFQKLISLPGLSLLWLILNVLWKVLTVIITFVYSMIIGFFDTSGKSVPFLLVPKIILPQIILNPYEKELALIIKDKIGQQLFETSIRVLVISPNSKETTSRLNGLLASFGQLNSSYQKLTLKHSLFPLKNHTLSFFKQRRLSLNSAFNPNPIISSSEISDLYHFPCVETTKTEDMVKIYSKELPAPLSVKNNTSFDVIFGKNKFAGTENDIGLTDDDRSRHIYIIGQTGSGKTTIIYHMAKDDIQKGRGVAVIDPHGDLAEDLLNCVPEARFNDCIYLNPFDIRHPIGINLLELKSGLDEDELEQEKELVCESVISVFRRIFSKDENTDAHRIEYILRNTIYTAFSVKEATIFTVYDLLNDPSFRDRVLVTLEDENLKNFWANEFGKAGNYQAVKMASGVTAKIGRFLFSPTAKRMLEQPKSTTNFDDILSSGKILICNLAEGKLGEDTSQLIGTTIISKLQQAAMRRVRSKASARTPFYVFVDEFQNFATTSFIKLLSGGRKFGLRLTIAEQSTAQQDDRNIVNVILANTGTVICFRTASPVDEQLVLSQFSPYVKQGDIVNLPRFRFYMKLSAVEPEEPFSGETIPITIQHDNETVERLVESSRNNYAIVYKKPQPKITTSKIKVPKKHSIKPEKSSDVGSLV